MTDGVETAIVTGGARGIGLAIARRLAADGRRIAVWDLDLAPLGRQSDFTVTHAETVDVADYTAVEAAARRTIAALGHIDILVNNAGVNGPTLPTWDYPLTAWDKVLAVDLTGVFYCCRALVPHMRGRRYGRIVNIASVAAKEGSPNAAAYAAAKAGVIGFTKALAKEVILDGITANCVTPAMAETDLLAEMTPEYIAAIKAKMLMGRLCTVAEIADIVAFAASRACSFTTGSVFDVSGGRAMY
jgi:3-oxoacyl-[acyl-carrier protein] reductase